MSKNKSLRKAHGASDSNQGKLNFFNKCTEYQYKKKRFKDIYASNQYGEQVK